jgi:two-component system sensor histidine kinase AtoS
MAVKVKKNGSEMVVQINVLNLLQNNVQSSSSIVLLQDVSAMSAALKQIQTMELLMSLGEIASEVSEHLRTPLATVNAYFQGMVKLAEENKYMVKKDVLESLLGNVSHINRVVRELVMFVKPAVRKEDGVDLNKLLNEAVLLSTKSFALSEIEFKRQFMQGLPTICADKNLLEQAIINILQNSLEAMESGGTLTTRLWRDYQSNMLVIGIEDTGGGINKEILPRVLEPFYTEKTGRMGLGLPVANRIIAEHGGFLNIQPTEKGTRAEIYLPIMSDGRAAAELRVLKLQ